MHSIVYMCTRMVQAVPISCFSMKLDTLTEAQIRSTKSKCSHNDMLSCDYSNL